MHPDDNDQITETIVGHVLPPAAALFRAGFMFTLGAALALLGVTLVVGVFEVVILAHRF